jgi:hypothetical protein
MTSSERQYSFIDVCEWFASRCDLILLLFDPFKLVSRLFLVISNRSRLAFKKGGSAPARPASPLASFLACRGVVRIVLLLQSAFILKLDLCELGLGLMLWLSGAA